MRFMTSSVCTCFRFCVSRFVIIVINSIVVMGLYNISRLLSFVYFVCICCCCVCFVFACLLC